MALPTTQPAEGRSRASPDATAVYKTHHPERERPDSPDTMGRGSFSSVRENDDGVAQTFTSTKFSSYAHGVEEAVDDESSVDQDMATEVQFLPPVTQPFSKLHGAWYPATNFRGWKQINVQGRAKTRSFGDLQMLNMMWNSPPARTHRGKPAKSPPGGSSMERLHMELLGAIIELLVIDIPPLNSVTTRNADLMALLLTSRTMHAATLNTLYKHITIPHSRIYKKFLASIREYPALGTIVRRLDFSHFNPATIFSTATERNQTQNLTSKTLLECFELTPHLQEFLAQEHVEDDLNEAVLWKLLTGMPRMNAIDLCGCSSAKFRDAFVATLPLEWPESLSISRLSLHKCLTLPPSVFEALLPRLKNITHLDLAGTKVTDAALRSIPETARITHLNLAKCHQLSPKAVVDFLTTHPAVTSSLVVLSVAMDARSHDIFGVAEVTAVLPRLPKTLRSLSLKGSKMDASHIELLMPLTRHLEELALGRCLTTQHLRPLIEQGEGLPHTLHYLDLSDMTIDEMDLANLFNNPTLLKASSAPLEVIEITDDVFARLNKAPQIPQRVGWVVKEFGSRSWLVRNGGRRPDDGQRKWKMGAESWGMRKIPVAKADVGGMYGSFMFGRKL